MKIKFTKMHGCGNDYIYIDCTQKELNFDIEKTAIKLSNRHFGIGGDGLVLIAPSKKADAYMKMFNSDGTQGKMCGNAIRCVAKYLYEKNIVKKENIKIETLSGIKDLKLFVEDEKVNFVVVNMGLPNFSSSSMPLNTTKKEVVLEEIIVSNKKYLISCVSMGNPHCVVFLDEDFNLDELDVNKKGPEFFKNSLFKEQVNIEFVKKTGESKIKMRVFERGSNETLACGTGACAAVCAMVKKAEFKKNQEVLVELLGGELKITQKQEGVLMKGGADFVFEGEIEI